jgi:hypothetical protein
MTIMSTISVVVIKTGVVEFCIDHVDLPLALIFQETDLSLFFIPGHKEITLYSLDLVIILIIDAGDPHFHFSFHGEPVIETVVPAEEVIIFFDESSFVIAFVKIILTKLLIIALIVSLIILLIVSLIILLTVALITLSVVPVAGLCLGK